MIRLVADVIGHISALADTTLLGIAGWSGAPAPRLDVIDSMTSG
jgi:hypothetical protein